MYAKHLPLQLASTRTLTVFRHIWHCRFFFFFYPVFQWFTGPWLGRRMSAVWFKIRLEEGIRFKEAGGKIRASLRLVGEWPLNLSGFLISLDLFSSIFILIKFSISRNCPFFFSPFGSFPAWGMGKEIYWTPHCWVGISNTRSAKKQSSQVLQKILTGQIQKAKL